MNHAYRKSGWKIGLAIFYQPWAGGLTPFRQWCVVFLAYFLSGCVSEPGWQDPGLSFKPAEFKAALYERVPNIPKNQVLAPFELPRKAKLLAKKTITGAQGGLNPVDLLVSILSDPKPDGLGIVYDWTVSVTAREALESGRGDCVSLAMVLVGLGRSLGWPIYFAEARPETPVVHRFQELTVLSSHMVVMVLTQEGPIIVDFLGLIDKTEYSIRPMDDLQAYAHLVNNVVGHQLVGNVTDDKKDWETALAGFKLVTQIQPDLGRGWNNLGIAYTRLGAYEDARAAYEKAVKLDTVFGSPARNLMIMETRALNKPVIIQRQISN